MKKRIITVVAILFLGVVVAGFFYRRPQKTITYGGGFQMPAHSVDRAVKAGEYCPSWDAKPGQLAADICLPLDK